MGRVLGAALAFAWIGTADAGPARKVPIETEPAGAMIYLGDVENGPICDATPCRVELPVGEQMLVIELAGHQRVYTSVVVPRRGRIKTSTFKLEKSIGTIVVDGPRGASVVVDDIDQGKAPIRVDVAAEAHRVVVAMNGKNLYDDYVEVGPGDETQVTVKRVAGGGDGDGGGTGDDESPIGEEPGAGSGGGAIVKSGPQRERGQYLRVSLAVDIGFRQFSYGDVQTPQTLRRASEAGQLLAGPVVELWPGTMAGIRPLRGLSLMGRLQFGLNPQPVTGAGIMDETTTYWQSLELSLRHRWVFGKTIGVEVGGGYVRDRHQFSGEAEDIELVPDVDYQSVRLGGRLSAVLGAIEPYLSFENRIVMSAGKLQARFAPGTSTSGLRGAVGVGLQLGAIAARIEGIATRYAWDFEFMPGAEFRAATATDSIQLIQLAVGYEY